MGCLVYWSMDFEYVEFKEVLIGLMDYYSWKSGNVMFCCLMWLGW